MDDRDDGDNRENDDEQVGEPALHEMQQIVADHGDDDGDRDK